MEESVSGFERQLNSLYGDSTSLAILRRGVGKPSDQCPQCWPFTMPFSNSWRDEQAIHYAVTLYALHQQSQTENMNFKGNGLGKASGRLVEYHPSKEAIKRRFSAAITADTLGELVVHLRGLVTLFRSNSIPLDYMQLRWDFYHWQDPLQKNKYRRQWGRDFYQTLLALDKEKQNV